VSPTRPEGDRRRFDLDRFLDDVRRTGTVVDGPVAGEPESPWVDPPTEWVVTAHRGTPLEPPYRVRLTAEDLAEAVEHDAGIVDGWWPGEEPQEQAYRGLLLGFDSALAGLVGALHGFVVREDGRLELTRAPLCPDVLRHLDPGSEGFAWSAAEPGTPEVEREVAERSRRSRHRRHSYLVLGYLEVEAAHERGERMDAAMGHLQDRLAEAFGGEVLQRFAAYAEQHGVRSTAELSDVMHAEDERFDAFLDALAGEPRDG
jgi:hypothetical protein